jgi:co-chaperonin GroES (HSP10)
MTAENSVAPTGDRVFARITKEARKVGLIHIPHTASSKLDVIVSEVVALGPEVKARPWELAVGDFILHARVCGVRYDGTLGTIGKKDADYLFLKEQEILAVINPESVGKVDGQAHYDGGALGTKDLSSL